MNRMTRIPLWRLTTTQGSDVRLDLTQDALQDLQIVGGILLGTYMVIFASLSQLHAPVGVVVKQ